VAKKNKSASGANADHGSATLLERLMHDRQNEADHHGTKTKSSTREDFRRGMFSGNAAKFVPRFAVSRITESQ
jgi:hypothetical protein